MSIQNVRLEVMATIEQQIGAFIEKYLIPVEDIWQPTDFLPDSTSNSFFGEIEDLRNEAKELDYNFLVTLIGDMVTEEALPTYESWLLDTDGVDLVNDNNWAKWIKIWTGEENRHGDVLNKYLYLSGRINMREVEKTTQYLINDGFDNGTGRDPYKNFVYTAFQELATNISHKRVAQLAAKSGAKTLAKMCKIIAGDEMRHHLAYCDFVKLMFEYDTNEMMKAYHYMMKHKIVMPAIMLKDSNHPVGTAFDHFAMIAQKIGVYTSFDYVDILRKINKYWDLENIKGGLDDEGKKAQEFLLKLPERMERIASRMTITDIPYKFSWILPNGAV